MATGTDDNGNGNGNGSGNDGNGNPPEKNRFDEEQHGFYIFVHFFAVRWKTTTVKWPDVRFPREPERITPTFSFFFFFLYLNIVHINIYPGQFASIVQAKQIGIIAQGLK